MYSEASLSILNSLQYLFCIELIDVLYLKIIKPLPVLAWRPKDFEVQMKTKFEPFPNVSWDRQQ